CWSTPSSVSSMCPRTRLASQSSTDFASTLYIASSARLRSFEMRLGRAKSYTRMSLDTAGAASGRDSLPVVKRRPASAADPVSGGIALLEHVLRHEQPSYFRGRYRLIDRRDDLRLQRVTRADRRELINRLRGQDLEQPIADLWLGRLQRLQPLGRGRLDGQADDQETGAIRARRVHDQRLEREQGQGRRAMVRRLLRGRLRM